MPTPEQLSAEKRARVAETCTGIPAYVKGSFVRLAIGDLHPWFDPRSNLGDKDALVTKVAQMINYKKHNAENTSDYEWARGLESRFVTHMATNNTPQIEALAFELIEGGKDD